MIGLSLCFQEVHDITISQRRDVTLAQPGPLLSHVRSTSDTGHKPELKRSPFGAKSGCEQLQQNRLIQLPRQRAQAVRVEGLSRSLWLS